MNQRIRCFQLFPNCLDTAKTVDDPLISVYENRVCLKLFFVQDLTVKFIEHVQW